jgi:hypothetical protein
MHHGPRATAEIELQLAQLGPAHVASIKKPGRGRVRMASWAGLMVIGPNGLIGQLGQLQLGDI